MDQEVLYHAPPGIHVLGGVVERPVDQRGGLHVSQGASMGVRQCHEDPREDIWGERRGAHGYCSSSRGTSQEEGPHDVCVPVFGGEQQTPIVVGVGVGSTLRQ